MTAVLLVEDDVPLRQALAGELRACGYEVLVAGAADDAVEQLCQRPIDVLVTDLRMGGRDGIDLLGDALRLSPRTRCVLMSAYATARDHQRATELGAVRVLCKPFTPDDLRDAVIEAVECARGFRGSFHGLSLVDMLQLFHLSRRSLRLGMLGERDGYVEFCEGEIVDARYGDVAGEGALPHLLRSESGAVSTGVARGGERTIERPFQNLLLDALCLLDEQARDADAGGASVPWRAPSSLPPAFEAKRPASAVPASLAGGAPAPSVPCAPSVSPVPPMPCAPLVPSVPPPRVGGPSREALDVFARGLRAEAMAERGVLVDGDGGVLCHAGEGGLLLADAAFLLGGLEALLDAHSALGPGECHVVQKGRAVAYVVCAGGRSCAYVLQGQASPARAAEQVRRLLEGLGGGA